jgi:hypothetical protein
MGCLQDGTTSHQFWYLWWDNNDNIGNIGNIDNIDSASTTTRREGGEGKGKKERKKKRLINISHILNHHPPPLVPPHENVLAREVGVVQVSSFLNCVKSNVDVNEASSPGKRLNCISQ